MKLLKTLRNYYLYCGIEKDEYNAVKKDAYISNYKVWKVLHFLMAAVFGLLCLTSLSDRFVASRLMAMNRWFYLTGFVYSVIVIFAFFKLKKDTLVAQLLIYLSMSFLFLLAAVINLNKPAYNATTFVVLLVVTPMFMIDKPYFMTIELGVATAVFLIWMRRVKPDVVWQIDMLNTIIFMIVGIFLNIIANALRIREFVLTREINIQKDTDELTGLKNKAALTRGINEFLADESKNRGIMLLLDVDRFKAINDTWGHDVGDSVIIQLGRFLGESFTGGEIVGRFGGDEFIVFVKDADEPETACRIAGEIAAGAASCVTLPDAAEKLSVSIGIALYRGEEKNYSEIFTRADAAMYQAKADREHRFKLYGCT